MVVDPQGRPILTLEQGQWKALSDHRVIYAHGSDHELAVIRDIFRLYTRDRLSLRAIAKRLNETETPSKDGAPWTEARVKRVLKNDLVLGLYVFNRTSRTLKGSLRHNPPEAWVTTRVLEPIISRAMFDLAKRRLAIRRHGLSREDVLPALARLLRARGFLTDGLIDACPYTPCASVVRRLFGNKPRLYELLEYTPPGRWRPAGQVGPATDKQLLDLLRKLCTRDGYVSQKRITADPSVPSASTYRERFGSLARAYELAGLPHSRTELQRAGRERGAARHRGDAIPKQTEPRWPTLPARFTDEELIECLRRLQGTFGYVSAEIIQSDEASPGPMLFIRRFGSLLSAYKRAGLPCTRSEIWSRAGHLRWKRRKSELRA